MDSNIKKLLKHTNRKRNKHKSINNRKVNYNDYQDLINESPTPDILPGF